MRCFLRAPCGGGLVMFNATGARPGPPELPRRLHHHRRCGQARRQLVVYATTDATAANR